MRTDSYSSVSDIERDLTKKLLAAKKKIDGEDVTVESFNIIVNKLLQSLA